MVNSAVYSVLRYLPLLLRYGRALPLVQRDPDVVLNSAEGGPQSTNDMLYYGLFSMVLVLLGGVFAGLTLGLMGQDEIYLKVINTSGTPREKKLSGEVLKLITRGKHWVLVTLLLSNVITNETLPIVLDRFMNGGWQAVISSTFLIVIFGEIIPQSICVKYGLEVGAFFAPFVLVLMYLMYPVAYPVAMLLDHLLGEDHGTVYKKSGLKTLVNLHQTMGVERLTTDEVTIISAVLDLKDKKVKEIMTPIENVFTLSADKVLDDRTVEEIFNSGFSRIPIYLPNEPMNFIGMLIVRILISYDPEDGLPISSFPLATLPETSPNTSCLNILNYFQEGKSHMCIVSERPGSSNGAIGVVTLEDVIEELIGEEIVDESDVFVDIHQHIMREQPGPLSKRHITSYLHHLYTESSKDSCMPLLNSKTNTYSSINDQRFASLPPPHVNGNNAHQLVVPSNLASNPLNIKKSFVTIKKLPSGELISPSNKNNTIESNKDSHLESPHPRQRRVSQEEEQLLEEHANLSHKAIDYIKNSGKPIRITSSTTTQSPEDNHSTDDPSKNVMISSSYQSTANGIVESVITVKGVAKTIIEDDPSEREQSVYEIEHDISQQDGSSSQLFDPQLSNGSSTRASTPVSTGKKKKQKKKKKKTKK
ncbi:Protein MAM3 [Nakaseomyces bracarensis]|uniref:Protein MAM3 n=1 Tax=Nakaseomyces bracarensis TaxID=273131 RepID=A0ABR4NQ89_9SACH